MHAIMTADLISTSTNATAGPSSPTPTASSESVMTRSSPVVLNVAYPAVQDIRGPEGLSGLWHVFSKCKGSLQDGARLENISWRHWYQACANANAPKSESPPFSSLHPVTTSSSYPSDAEAASSLSRTTTNELESVNSYSRRGSNATTATRRSGSPHSPLGGSSHHRRDSWNSTMAEERSRSKERERLSPVNAMGPRREPIAEGQDGGFSLNVKDDSLPFPGTNGQIRFPSSLANGSTGTTPRPASYPTPPTCRPGYQAMRSHSHAADQRSDSSGSCRARHDSDTTPRETHVTCRCGERARWKKVDRSFGQVLTDVFRVPSITDVATEGRVNRLRDRERLDLMKKDMAALKWSQEMEKVEKGDEQVDARMGQVERESQKSTTTSDATSSEVAPPPLIITQPPRDTSTTTSQSTSRRTSTDHGGSPPRGPQVNVLEPTPVPSRVGSLGDAHTPPFARSHPVQRTESSSTSDIRDGKDIASAASLMVSATSSTSDAAATAAAARPSPAASKMSKGLVPLTAMQEDESIPKSPPACASTSSKQSDRSPMTPQQRSAARKSNKKSIFFIQSPGHAAKQMRRQGSPSGSEGSVSNGSGSLSPMMHPKLEGSPLSAESLPSATAELDTTDPAHDTPVVASLDVGTHAVIPAASSAALATASSTTTTSKRRMSSASQKQPQPQPPHIGHRKTSNERTHHHAHLNKHHHGAHLVPPKRSASAAQMAGKFQGEKARAAEVINARLQAQQIAEKEKQAEARSKLSLAKRQQSEPHFAMAQTRKTQGDPIVVANEDDDEWSSETEETLDSAAGNGAFTSLPGGRPAKQGKSKEMDLAKAADEARRQRELFAKRAIYGSNGEPQKPQSGPGPSMAANRPGLLSNLFDTQRDVIRRNASMVDLMPKRQLSNLATSSNTPHNVQPTPTAHSPHIFNLNRSKSVVAMPVATGVSASKDGFVGPNGLDTLPDKMESRHASSRGKLRLPPKPHPDEHELSPSSSPQDSSSLLATSEALRRIVCLAGRRREPSKVNFDLSPAPNDASATSRIPPPMETQTSAPLHRVHSNPIPMQYCQGMMVEPAMPQTPTTRRRQMLATELPEDLRLNLIWERRSRTPLYPPKRTAALKASASAHDLPSTERESDTQERDNLRMKRQDSQPIVSKTSDSPKDRQDSNNGGQARRRQVNLLSGGAILRPLTKSHLEPSARLEAGRESNSPRAGILAQRAKSTANVVDLGREEDDDWQKFDRVASEATGIQRRNTAEPWERARDLKRRQGELSSSFRSHGW